MIDLPLEPACHVLVDPLLLPALPELPGVRTPPLSDHPEVPLHVPHQGEQGLRELGIAVLYDSELAMGLDEQEGPLVLTLGGKRLEAPWLGWVQVRG